MKKKTKIKEYIKIFKQFWAIPRYRAIIKLSLYGIMFMLIFIMANIGNTINPSNNENKSYTEIVNSLDLENAEISYTLNINNMMYKLEGKIKNNSLTGYLENNLEINKIMIKDNIIYDIKNNETIINNDLNSLFISKLLIPSNIIDLVKNESAYINKEKEKTTYTFELNDNNIKYEIEISINSEKITNIKVFNENFEYNMLVTFDKNI